MCASATIAIAGLAGAPPEVMLRLGLAMLGIQFSIGALNDVVDAPLDAGQKPRKPIPAGLVTRRTALVIAAAGAVVGILLSAVSGLSTAIAALGCLGLGYAYDLRLSRTALSWLPLSLALPLLPIHAWLGATGSIPGGLVSLVPVGALAGAGLALANGLVDLERDTSTARGSAVVRLGRRGTWAAQTLVLGAAAVFALLIAPAVPPAWTGPGGPGMDGLRIVRTAGVWLGVGLLVAGAGVLAAKQPHLRERGWELEAIGIAALGVGWLAGTAASVAGGGAGG